MHQEDTGVNAAAAAHKANPVSSYLVYEERICVFRDMADQAVQGPVHAENIGEPASKEELKKRAEELNK